jgi:Cell wall-associated hydrolases (invasion-associated proteins)
VKYQFLLLTILIGAVSCTNSRRGQSNAATEPARKQPAATQSSPTFIENFSVKPATGQSSVKTTKSSAKSTTSAYPALADESVLESTVSTAAVNAALLFKYSILLDVPVEDLTDFGLLEFVESWYGTKYKYGGNDRNGVDCSAFSKDFICALYNVNIPRTSSEQYKTTERINKKDLREGDLVFFYTRGRRNGVSHVGVYLRNGKFVHASTSSGVVISDLEEEYYRKNYAGAGRVR